MEFVKNGMREYVNKKKDGTAKEKEEPVYIKRAPTIKRTARREPE